MIKTAKETEKYFEAVGRRKTAQARVRIWPANRMTVTVNNRELNNYFQTEYLRAKVLEPFSRGQVAAKFRISALLRGGGVSSQAEALRHGLARVLVKFNADWRKKLKQAKLLKRDARAKERRKFGLKKARKAPQWSKR